MTKWKFCWSRTVQLRKSTRSIDVPEVDFEDEVPEEIEVSKIQEKYVQARVTVTAKVRKVGDLESVRTGKQKQDVYIADHSGTAKVTLWEEHVGILQEQSCYRLENFVVREWGGTKYLAMYTDSQVTTVDMLDVVATSDPTDDEKILQDAQIVAVTQLGRYRACMRCGARVEPSLEESTFARCSIQECMMLQKVEFCSVRMCVQNLMLMVKPSTFITLSIHGRLLLGLARVTTDSEITEEHLLSLPALKEVTYNDKNIITAIA